jgi:hypothetical protein
MRSHPTDPDSINKPSPTEAEQTDTAADQIAAELLKQPTWSAKIRYLASQGFRNRSISTILSELRGYPLSMQHVNNVLSNPLKSPEGQRKAEQTKQARAISLKTAREDAAKVREAKRTEKLKQQQERLKQHRLAQQQKAAAKVAQSSSKKEPQLTEEESKLLEQARRLTKDERK